MMLGKAVFSLLLSASAISAKYLTFITGSSEVTTTVCRTSVGTSSVESVHTNTYARTALLPEVEIVLADSTPATTVTPPAVTATNTVQTYTTTTVTASTATGTFSTTTTIFETDSITTIETSVSTTTAIETSTSTSIEIEPAPSNWISVEDSTGLKNKHLEDEAHLVLPQADLRQSDLQQPLQDDESSPTPSYHGRLELRGLLPIPSPPGGNMTGNDLYPSSVTCMHYVRTRYVKMIVYVHQHTTTTTIPAATSTTISTETVTSTTTIVPDSVTVIKSFSTTSTTTTTLTSAITDIATTTERVNATVTESSYAACMTENVLGPLLDNGQAVREIGIQDIYGHQQDRSLTESPYLCCVSCLLSEQNCQISLWQPSGRNAKRCKCLINPAVCHGQDYVAGELYQHTPEYDTQGIVVSNGPCAQIIEYKRYD